MDFDDNEIPRLYAFDALAEFLRRVSELLVEPEMAVLAFNMVRDQADGGSHDPLLLSDFDEMVLSPILRSKGLANFLNYLNFELNYLPPENATARLLSDLSRGLIDRTVEAYWIQALREVERAEETLRKGD